MEQRAKILMFVDDYSGGAGNVMQILANEFYRKGEYEPVVVFLNPHTDRYKLNEGVRVVEHPLSRYRSVNKLAQFTRSIRSIRRIIEAEAPVAIISFLDNINTLVALSRYCNRSIPIVVCERSNPIAIKPSFAWRLLRAAAYRRAEAITVQCSNFVEFMPSQRHKMEVTPNPVLAPMHTKSDYAVSGAVRFVTCARLSPIKQHRKMVEAFDVLYKRGVACVLVIYGEGVERAALEQMVAERGLQGAVMLPGAVKNVHQVLAQSDVYLMTSQQEGFPNALCEAMAVGLPSVSFACHEGLRDIVQDGDNGFLVAPDDVAAMADRMEQLANDATLRERMGRAAGRIAERYNLERTYEQWHAIIARLVAQTAKV